MLSVNASIGADAKINSRQSASARLTYLGPDAGGNGRFSLSSTGVNRYREKGNTFRIVSVFTNEKAEPEYVHIQLVGVDARYLKSNPSTNTHTVSLTLSKEVTQRISGLILIADNKGNSNRVKEAIQDAVKDGILKGIKDGIAKLIETKMASAAGSSS